MPGRMSPDRVAVLSGLVAPLALAVILVPFRSGLPNTDAALALILVVVAVAASGRRLAGVLAAVSAAAWFDFFLTVPYERFTITRRPDIETTVLLLAIGAAVTEIAVRGRRQHAAAARRAGYLTEQVCGQLTGVLQLSGCRFQDGVAGIGGPARLLHDGTVMAGARVWDIEQYGPPPDRDIELLAEAGGLLQGRFLLTPSQGTRPGLEQRLVAVALADQTGAALSGGQLASRRG